MTATTSGSWWPAIIVLLGGGAWTLLWIAIATRYERFGGPFSLAFIPVLAGLLGLGALVEIWW